MGVGGAADDEGQPPAGGGSTRVLGDDRDVPVVREELSRVGPFGMARCQSNMCSSTLPGMQAHDPTFTRPIAAPLERCAEFLGVDLASVREAAAHVEPYVRVDGTKVWSLMQLERQLRPNAYGRVRGGYIARRRPRATA